MEKQIVVKSTVGLHASLAAKIVKTSSNYTVDINLNYNDKLVDFRSYVISYSKW